MSKLQGEILTLPKMSGSVSAPKSLSGNIGAKTVNVGGIYFTTDETLSLKDGVLSVNTAQEPEPDNTLPITSAAVHTTIGNIEIILQTI